MNDSLEGGRFEFSAALVVFLAHAESACTTLQIPHSISPRWSFYADEFVVMCALLSTVFQLPGNVSTSA